ncbi:MAG: hypothetical protein ACI4JW_08235 [Oscillospiraceae bacterium]
MGRSTTKQKKSSAGKNIAIFFIVFVILEGLLFFGLSKVFKNEDSVVKIGGYSFYIMDSDHMGKDAPKKSLVIASNGTPGKDKLGFAVLCKNVGKEGTTVAWLYDISSKGDTVDGVVYTVYQESAPSQMYDLKSDDIIGIATSYYITAGKIISFVTTPFGMGVCVGAPLVLLILIELIIAIARRSDDDDYDEDDDDEYDDDENVTLDDFLYGGENDEVYTTSKPKDTYEEEFEDKYASMMNTAQPMTTGHVMQPIKPVFDEPDEQETEAFEQPEEPVYEQPAPAPVSEQPAPAPVEEPKPEIDPSYYEKASKLIDEAAAETPAEEEIPAPQPTSEPQRRPKPANRPASAQHRPNAQRRRPPQNGAPRRNPNAPQRRPRPQVQAQDANAALEQLMKMMEEEQNKLKNKTDK